MFGTKHLIILALCVVVGVLFYILTSKYTLKQWIKLFLIIGIISEVTKICYYILNGKNNRS